MSVCRSTKYCAFMAVLLSLFSYVYLFIHFLGNMIDIATFDIFFFNLDLLCGAVITTDYTIGSISYALM